jgi:two-component system nitrate/nitrite response regulator NarL
MGHETQIERSEPTHSREAGVRILELECLLRDILRVPSRSGPSSPTRAGEVLRVRVDGVDYAVVRCAPSEPPAHAALSPREQAIIRLIIKGYSNKTLARVLEISPWTVATHLRRIFAKLDVSSRAEMVACVLRGNLLGQDQAFEERTPTAEREDPRHIQVGAARAFAARAHTAQQARVGSTLT